VVDEIAGDEDPLGRQPGDDVAAGVAAAEVLELDDADCRGRRAAPSRRSRSAPRRRWREFARCALELRQRRAAALRAAASTAAPLSSTPVSAVRRRLSRCLAKVESGAMKRRTYEGTRPSTMRRVSSCADHCAPGHASR
jgi:hypothetical protein